MRRTTALLSLTLVAATLAGAGAVSIGATPVDALEVDANAPAALPDDAAADDAADRPAVAPGAGPELVTAHSPNASEYLVLPRGQLTDSAYRTADLDVAGATAVETAELRGRHRLRTVRERFYGTEDPAERDRIVSTTLRDVADRVERLRADQRAALGAYSDDEIGSDRLFRTVGLLQARADQESRIVSVMLGEFQSTPGFSIGDRTPFNRVRGEVVAVRGSVRSQIVRALDGSRGPIPVYVDTSAEGLALSRTTADAYHRDSYAASLRAPDGVDRFRETGNAINAASTRTRELYPWLARTVRSVTALGDTGVYRARLAREGVTTTTYLDGNTSTAFREVQRRTLSEVSLDEARSTTADGLRLRVNRTHDTGPMLVSLERVGTGVPVAGSIAVNGHSIGETGPDGTRWIVEPRGVVRVNATTPDGTVTLRFN